MQPSIYVSLRLIFYIVEQRQTADHDQRERPSSSFQSTVTSRFESKLRQRERYTDTSTTIDTKIHPTSDIKMYTSAGSQPLHAAATAKRHAIHAAANSLLSS